LISNIHHPHHPHQSHHPMSIIDIPTEQTTAATDILLSLIGLVVSVMVFQAGKSRDLKKSRIWTWAFALLSVASIFGAAAHGFTMSERMNFILWQPINLSLGLTVALFAAGVVYDLTGSAFPRWIIPVFISAGILFYLITILIPGTFAVFILYEAAALLFALGAYFILSIRHKNRGYGLMTAGILISILASVIQSLNFVHVTIIWEFDHNGIFHLLQMIGLIFLLLGLRKGFLTQSIKGG